MSLALQRPSRVSRWQSRSMMWSGWRSSRDHGRVRWTCSGWRIAVRYDPAMVDTAGFLQALYRPGESVVCFDNEYSQGCAVWPADEAKLPRAGKNGCWYLAQPVDGQYHINPRSLDKDGNAKQSRRSEESVTSWRYLVIESDEAPLRLWLGALVKLPLRIAAIYTSGGRSVHALVRVDAKTQGALGCDQVGVLWPERACRAVLDHEWSRQGGVVGSAADKAAWVHEAW